MLYFFSDLQFTKSHLLTIMHFEEQATFYKVPVTPEKVECVEHMDIFENYR